MITAECIATRIKIMLMSYQHFQVAEEKLHEQWRINCPELRELESQQLQQSAQEEWENQIQTRQQVHIFNTQHTSDQL